jgi:hypothetical protein
MTFAPSREDDSLVAVSTYFKWLCMRLISDCEGHARCCTCAVRESFTHGDAIALLSGGFDRADMCPTTAKSAQATKHMVCGSPYGTGRVKSRRGNLERLKLTRLVWLSDVTSACSIKRDALPCKRDPLQVDSETATW